MPATGRTTHRNCSFVRVTAWHVEGDCRGRAMDAALTRKSEALSALRELKASLLSLGVRTRFIFVPHPISRPMAAVYHSSSQGFRGPRRCID